MTEICTVCKRYPDLYGLGEEYWIGHPYGPWGRCE